MNEIQKRIAEKRSEIKRNNLKKQFGREDPKWNSICNYCGKFFQYHYDNKCP